MTSIAQSFETTKQVAIKKGWKPFLIDQSMKEYLTPSGEVVRAPRDEYWHPQSFNEDNADFDLLTYTHRPSVAPRVSIRAITIFSSEVVTEDADIIVIVGPNNSGKSACLKDVNRLIANERDEHIRLVDSVDLLKAGTPSDVINYFWKLGENTVSHKSAPLGITILSGKSSAHVPLQAFNHLWGGGKNSSGMSALSKHFCSNMDTMSRLSSDNLEQELYSLQSGSPGHPIQHIFRDRELELEASAYFEEAFQQRLVLDNCDGAKLKFRLQPASEPRIALDSRSQDSALAAAGLELLSDQGDGMKSFGAMVLHVLANPAQLIFLDEPEAFLHPPQARLVGRMLAKNLKGKSQVLIATHSADVIQGLLAERDVKLTVVRLNRSAQQTSVNVLNTDDVRALWRDPLLRHSNALEGLFYRRVIICESDGDCKFYSSVLDRLLEVKANKLLADVLFVNCSGKDRMINVAKALKALGVDVTVVGDMDVLNDLAKARSLYEVLGGTLWSINEPKLQLVCDFVKIHPPSNKEPQVLSVEIAELVKGHIQLTKKLSKEMASICKFTTAWDLVKKQGIQFFSGNARTSIEDLLATFKLTGLFLVPVGELEGFAPHIGVHGPKWVERVIARHDLLLDNELEAARGFVAELAKSDI